MRRIAQHTRIRIGAVAHGYGRRRLKQAVASAGPDWSFWIPVLGIALFVSPLLGTAVASSFPEIGPRPLTTKEVYAAVTPLKLRLDPISPPLSAALEAAATSPLLPDARVPAPAEPPVIPSASPLATASALTTSLPLGLDELEIEEEGAAERNAELAPGAAAVAGWRHSVLADAQSRLGTRYVWGGTRPGGFDCSGFVQYVMERQGIELPRTAREMRSAARPIAPHQLQPGDLVFFRNPDHVGIYMGNSLFIHASSGRGRVTVSTLDGGYYQKRYVGSGRVAD